MRTFISPRVLFGSGALKGLGDEIKGKGNKAAIITGKTTAKFVGPASNILKKAGFEIFSWDGSEANPSFEVVRKGSLEISGFKPDWVIGIGGGSVMDCAKIVWLLYERPELTDANLKDYSFPVTRLNLRQKSRQAMIPTTSGTGSEVTWAAVITDKAARRKVPVANKELIPDVAILDPELTLDMPKGLTADSAMDAMGHAVEAYTCTWANEFSDSLCLGAVKTLFDWVPVAYKDGSNLAAREKVHNAASVAALAMGNSNASLGHALAHSLGAVLEVPHGKAVGLATAYALEYSASPAHPLRPGAADPGEKLAALARLVGIEASSDREAAKKFVQKVRDLLTELGEPLTIKDAGVSGEKFRKELDVLVHHASMDPDMLTVPRRCELPNFRELFQAMWSGR